MVVLSPPAWASLHAGLAALVGIAVFTSAERRAHAQIVNGSPIEVSLDSYAPSQVDVSERPAGAPAGPLGSVQLSSFLAKLSVPLSVEDDTYLIPGLSYRLLRTDWLPARSDGFGVDALHAPRATFTVVHRFDDRWTGMYQGGIGFASDFEGGLTIDDVQLSGLFILNYRFLEELSLGAGVGYDRRTGYPLPLPLVTVRWLIADDLMLRGLVPSRFGLAYRAASWLSASLEGSYEGERFHLDEEKFGAADLQAAYSVFKVGTGLTVHLPLAIHLELESGVALSRTFEGLVDGETVFDLSQRPGGYLGLRAWFGLSGWEDPDAMRKE